MSDSEPLPSYQQGYATCAAESAYPELWKGAIFASAPALGNTGANVRDATYGRNGVFTTPAWSGMDATFNGSTSRIQYTSDAGLIPSTSSLTVLVYCRRSAPGSNQWHLYKGTTSSASSDCYGSYYASATSLRAYVSNGTTDATAAFTVANDTIWHQTGTWWRGGKLYVVHDGMVQAASETSLTGTLSQATSALAIGRAGSTNAFYFPGLIRSAYVWSRALAASEIRHLYANPLAPFRLRTRVFASAGAAPATNRRRRFLAITRG